MPFHRARTDGVTNLIRFMGRTPTSWVPFPGGVFRSVIAARRWAAGLREHRVEVDGFVIPYLEAGSGPPLVLLHGFGDRKDSFVEAVRHLTRNFRVVLPDLPGFSEASQPPDYQYSVANQTRLLRGLLAELRIQRLHLGGNSLGGAISAHFACDEPDRVRSLFLVDAAGVQMPRRSQLYQQLDAGKNPFVVDSVDGYREFMEFVLEIVPTYPDPVVRHLAEQEIARAAMNEKIMNDLLEEDLDLTPRLSNIQCPTFVLWGALDRVIDPSAGRVYLQNVPDAELTVLDGVGHVPQYEVPDQTARLLARFLMRR